MKINALVQCYLILPGVVVFTVLLTNVHSQGCNRFYFGRNCRYSCHCDDDRYDCQRDSTEGIGGCGTCSSTHSIRPKCQRENIALSKTTSQRSSGSTRPSSSGNDGDTSTCSQTLYTAGQFNWWQVDLGRSYSLKWMDYLMFDGRKCHDYDEDRERTLCKLLVKGFTVYVSNTRMRPGDTAIPNDVATCYTDTTLYGWAPTPIQIECSNVLVGRYVIIALPGVNNLGVCELEVFQCEDYTFGRECDKECNCVSDTEVCDKVTGACPNSGCMAGYTGTDCLSACNYGKFGSGCVFDCNCKTSNSCPPTDGSCTNYEGCRQGFTSAPGTTNCQVEATACASGRFGVNCLSSCNCKTQSEACRSTDGFCTSGCADGYQGTGCQTVCNGKFGSGCVFDCNCKSSNYCPPTDGSCTNYEGCRQGYTSAPGTTNCQVEVCNSGKFGSSCQFDCKCSFGTDCPKADGSCTNYGGCTQGFESTLGQTNCQKACSQGNYGYGCASTCHCEYDSQCSSTNGACSGKCAAGWYNSAGSNNCPYSCVDGKFGVNCAQDCLCRDNRYCQKSDGKCTFGGCPQGSKGDFCKQTCSSGTFGYDCTGTCRCLSNSQCSIIDGECSGDCVAGQYNRPGTGLQNCPHLCPRGKFGVNCIHSCNCKNTQERCLATTGFCSSGCADGWQGTDCLSPCGYKKFGNKCSSTCNCKTTDEDCNKVTGACGSGCPAGKKPINCLLNCDLGTFGENCAETCRCANKYSCSRTTGHCSYSGSKCEAGYINIVDAIVKNCQTACTSGTFGYGCKGTCRCSSNSQCSIIDGKCSGDCEAGQYNRPGTGAQNCQDSCPDGKFGVNCTHSCNCKDTEERCLKTTGSCSSGCADGWQGTDCLSPCGDMKFGYKCSYSCNCKAMSEECNKVTGACVSGCPAGKKPINCQNKCDPGTFGDNCVYPCHCINENDCSYTDGRCSDSCEAGWMNAPTATVTNCQTKCPNGMFGFGCTGSCRCLDKMERCRYIDGFCGSGCQAGWQGQGCNRECDDGTFGVQCKLSCNCKDPNEICEQENGDCKTGCPEGKYPPNCQSSCPAGLYGPKCETECHCLDVANTCNGDNGTCMYGCAQGFTGPACQTIDNTVTIKPPGKIKDNQSDGQTDSNQPGIGAIVGGAVGAVVLVILVALVIVFIVRRKRKNTEDPSRTDGSRNTKVKRAQHENTNSNIQGDYLAPIPDVIQKEQNDTDNHYYSSAEHHTYEAAQKVPSDEKQYQALGNDYYNTSSVQDDYQNVLGNKPAGDRKTPEAGYIEMDEKGKDVDGGEPEYQYLN